jgi:hypothetical protein
VAVFAGGVDVAADVEAVLGEVLPGEPARIFCWVFTGRTPRSETLFVGQISDVRRDLGLACEAGGVPGADQPGPAGAKKKLVEPADLPERIRGNGFVELPITFEHAIARGRADAPIKQMFSIAAGNPVRFTATDCDRRAQASTRWLTRILRACRSAAIRSTGRQAARQGISRRINNAGPE